MARNTGVNSDEKRLYTMKDGDIIKRLINYAKPYTGLFVLAFFYMVLTVGFGIIEPILIGESINVIIYDFDGAQLLLYLSLLSVIVSMILLRS